MFLVDESAPARHSSTRAPFTLFVQHARWLSTDSLWAASPWARWTPRPRWTFPSTISSSRCAPRPDPDSLVSREIIRLGSDADVRILPPRTPSQGTKEARAKKKAAAAEKAKQAVRVCARDTPPTTERPLPDTDRPRERTSPEPNSRASRLRVLASDARPSRSDPTRVVPLAQAKKATPKKAPKKATPAKSPKKKAAKVKATATKSSDKRGAVLAKKRGMRAAAVKAADDKARKAALGRAKPKKAAPVKGTRVGKKVTLTIRVTNKQGPKSKGPATAAAKTSRPAPGTLRIIPGAGASTPPKPKPGSQRAGTRGKLKSGAAARKAASAQRQSVGRGGKMAGARGMDLGVSRRAQKPAAKTKASRGSTGQMFPVGTSPTGKVKRTAQTGKGGKAKGGRGGRR